MNKEIEKVNNVFKETIGKDKIDVTSIKQDHKLYELEKNLTDSGHTYKLYFDDELLISLEEVYGAFIIHQLNVKTVFAENAVFTLLNRVSESAGVKSVFKVKRFPSINKTVVTRDGKSIQYLSELIS
ncbi:hypothetical protein [Levilactobacillus phage ENFP1]|nr:hypothetical protein [Levilactobacillus phage ENFP1]